eukprot:1246440-Ditylum_brightwellii.AAC.1
MAKAEGRNGNIIFTNRAGEEIEDILLANQYEDWPKEANLTGVSLQCEQDKQVIIVAYTVEPEEEDEQHAAPSTPLNPDLGPDKESLPIHESSQTLNPELGPPLPPESSLNKPPVDAQDSNDEHTTERWDGAEITGMLTTYANTATAAEITGVPTMEQDSSNESKQLAEIHKNDSLADVVDDDRSEDDQITGVTNGDANTDRNKPID